MNAIELNEIFRSDDLPACLRLLQTRDPLQVDINDWTLLHLAAHYSALRCATLLVSLHPSLAKAKTKSGDIPLLLALHHKPTQDLVQTLLPHSQDTPNWYGCKPSDLAKNTPYEAMLQKAWGAP